MAKLNLRETSIKFTDPVRKFKSNDPDHYTVDNLPICELENNIKALKEQFENASIENVQRQDIAELKPYVNGEDNVIKVRPGRFIGRVNDAYNLDAFQRMQLILGQGIGENDRWEVWSLDKSDLLAIIDRFKSILANDALGVNGITERVSTFPAWTSELIDTGLLTNST